MKKVFAGLFVIVFIAASVGLYLFLSKTYNPEPPANDIEEELLEEEPLQLVTRRQGRVDPHRDVDIVVRHRSTNA